MTQETFTQEQLPRSGLCGALCFSLECLEAVLLIMTAASDCSDLGITPYLLHRVCAACRSVARRHQFVIIFKKGRALLAVTQE